jgi:hypothetical protein
MKREENHTPADSERGYNGRDAVKTLRGFVNSTNDRDELRLIDSQLRRLLAQIKEKMTGRRRPR